MRARKIPLEIALRGLEHRLADAEGFLELVSCAAERARLARLVQQCHGAIAACRRDGFSVDMLRFLIGKTVWIEAEVCIAAGREAA